MTQTPVGEEVLQCVCTIDGVFSGACYERNDAACDFDDGCCAKYFSGN